MSLIVFPISNVSKTASSKLFFFNNSANFKITFFLCDGAALDQIPDSNVFLATLTALSISSFCENTTLLISLPLIGLILSKVFPVILLSYFPLINSCDG